MIDEAIIKFPKMVLVLSQKELLDNIPGSLLETALKRGKGYESVKSVESRQGIIDRWRLYSMLKGNHITEEAINAVESMNITELREGVIEYLLMIMHSGG